MKYLIIDLFCGAGGVTTGMENARDSKGNKIAKVIACVNHDPLAIESHAANHPGTLHFTEDIRTLDTHPLVEHLNKNRLECPTAKVILWASLECTNFSNAKGGLPRDADSRTLALDLFRYMDALQPDYLMIENVREFMSWGDLDTNGKPISRDKGRDFVKWCNRVQKMGYDFSYKLLNSADFGAHTSRIRFFGIFAKHGLPIRFPNPTHSKAAKKQAGKDMFGEQSLQPWKPVREVLDFTDEGKSVFERDKPLAERTLKRILAGLKKYVTNPHLTKFYGSADGTYSNGHASIESPSPTLTTTAQIGIVQADFLLNYTHSSNANSVNDPCPTITTKPKHALTKPIFLDKYFGTGVASSLDAPSPTLTAKDRLSKVSAVWLDKQYNGDWNHQTVEEPAGTITTSNKLALVTAEGFLLDGNGYANPPQSLDKPCPALLASRRHHYLFNPQYGNTGSSVDNPCFTLIARMDKKPPYLICAESGDVSIVVFETDSPTMVEIKQFMAAHGIVDIKMRMLRVMELKRITGFPENYVLKGNQSDQKKFIGNAVPCIVPQRMIEATNDALIESYLVAA